MTITRESYNEEQLLSRTASGDELAYKQLFERYWPHVYSVALIFAKQPELAEDAAQEVFTQIWLKRERLREVREFKAYLYTAARNVIFNTLRTKIFTGDFTAYLQEFFADTAQTPAAQLEFKQASHVIEAGINQLTPQQQKVFRLSRFEGLTHAEIAQRTGLSPRTVKNYMVSAILSLRNYLNAHAHSLVVFLWILVYL